MCNSCSLSSLYTSAFNALYWTNESSYQLTVDIFEFPDDVRSISLKFRFDACLECQVTLLSSKLNFKKHVCKKYWFRRKKSLFTSWIWTHDLLNASQFLYPLSHTAVVFDGMLLELFPLLCLQPTVERNLITTFTCSDRLEVGGWWKYDVRQLICRCRQSQASYRRDGRMAF